MVDRPDNTLPTDPESPKRPTKEGPHKPGTGEGEYPVHPDRPNLPDEPKPDNTLPGDLDTPERPAQPKRG